MTHDPFTQQINDALDAIHPGLSTGLAELETLTDDTAQRAIDYLVGTACKAQNTALITLAREKLAAVPCTSYTPRIERAEADLKLSCDWEFRRLLELYDTLGLDTTARAEKQRPHAANEDIREVIDDFCGPHGQ